MKTVMQAAILIGGKGTRLGQAVTETPKPLLEVCGRPFVEHVMLNLRRFGFTDFLLLAGYRADVVKERYCPETSFLKEIEATVRVVVEPEPLGTAGALKYASNYLQDEFLLINGDSIFDFNYLDLCRCYCAHEPDNWLGRVALLPVESADRYGFVDLEGSLIHAFREKPDAPQSGLINSGVYWLKAAVLDHITSTPCSLEQDIFPRLAAQSQLVGRTYNGYFIDIGIPKDLGRARDELLERMRKPAAFLDRDGTLNHDAGYTHRIDQFQWVEGAQEAIKALNDAGFIVFLVTNQAGIARGYYGPAQVNTLHQWMQDELAESGAHIDDIRFCPHHPEGTVEKLAIECRCRKPGTAMLEALIDAWQPRLQDSFMLGDAAKDAAAGNAIGIRGVQIETGDILPVVKELLTQYHQEH